MPCKLARALRLRIPKLARLMSVMATLPCRAFSIAYMDAATTHVKTGETFPIIFGKDALRSAA